MEDYTNNQTQYSTRVSSYDEGLRSYFLKIYNYMAGGLAVTGIVAFVVANTPALLNIIFGNQIIAFIVMLAPLGIVFYLGMGFQKMSSSKMQMWFWIFSGVMGLSLASIFLVYTGASIAKTFFVTAGMFGGMSLFGYTTKKDLSGMGSFLIMGLWGIILASVVNIFLGSPGLEFAISILGILIFTGLTAWDTQKLKRIYNSVNVDTEMTSKVTIMGALNLYIDFINIFLFLLRFMGDRR